MMEIFEGMSTPIDTLKKALVECQKKIGEMPDFDPLISIEKQLKYLIEIVEDSNLDRNRVSEIIIGIYAVREFESRDMEFAELLYDVDEVVDLIKANKI